MFLAKVEGFSMFSMHFHKNWAFFDVFNENCEIFENSCEN